jgi:uncharacterized protein (TIGR00251 family)
LAAAKGRPVLGTLAAVIVPTAFSPHPDGTLVDVWVVPGASQTKLAGWYDGALRVRVAAPPEGGRANRALLALLRETTGVRRARVVAGATARRKVVVLEEIDPAEAARLLTK